MSTSLLLGPTLTASPTYGSAMVLPRRGEGNVSINSYTFHAVEAGTGAVTATVIIQVSNTGLSTDWITLGTIPLTGTTNAADGFAASAKWHFCRAGVTAISGTGATVQVFLGW